MSVDLLITNGKVIDPSAGLIGEYDVLVDGGKIVGIHPSGMQHEATQVLDATDCLVVPGLIDLHVHVFENRSGLSVNADQIGVFQGVTTVVDAGSAGAYNFEQFRLEVIETSQTEVLSFLNISGYGLCAEKAELSDLSFLAPEKTAEWIQSDSRVRGIKARMSRSVVKDTGIKALEIAKETAQRLQVPLMVHIGNSPPQLGEIMRLLDKGDIVTHAFHGKDGGIIGEDGDLIREAKEALQRGVQFDVGHGSESFSFKTLKRALSLGVTPFSISTDLHARNVKSPVKSMLVTMSKMMALGISLQETIRASTANPAKALGLSNQIGTLIPQTIADITILQVERIITQLIDSDGNQITSDHQLVPCFTIKSGKVLRVRERYLTEQNSL